jgi:DNA-binding MarR family transcriptional regulator
MQLMRQTRENHLMQAVQEMGLNQHMVLLYLYNEGASSIGRVRELLGCAPSTASELVERLVRQRMVAKHRAEEDGRRVLIDLTSQGHRFLRKLRQEFREANGQWLVTLDDGEQKLLLDSLENILELSRKAAARTDAAVAPEQEGPPEKEGAR